MSEYKSVYRDNSKWKCRTCNYKALTASELASHLGQSDHDTKWAKAYRTREANKFGQTSQERYEEYRRQQTSKHYREQRIPDDPIQIQVIKFFKTLYEKQDMGFNDNEILTMIAIGKKQAKGNN